MILTRGNMFDEAGESDIILVTTNSYVKKSGELVMGRGAALEAKIRWPNLPLMLGSRIGHLGRYGILMPRGTNRVGAFQVKAHFGHNASKSLIHYSTEWLADLACMFEDVTFHLNYPGIGNGGLCKRDVAPILAPLPDNVKVWELP